MMRKERLTRICIIFFFVFFAVFGHHNGTRAETFPSKSLDLIIPLTPGSAGDVFARTLAQATEKVLGQNIVCQNKPGGGHTVAISYVLTQPTDGYTMFNTSETLTYAIASGQAPFGLEAIAPVARINGDVEVFMVPQNSPFKALEEFVAFAKKNPGKIKIGGVATASPFHHLAVRFSELADFKFVWIPYAGGSKVVADLLGQHINAAMITSGNIRSHIQSGKLRALAITTEQRLKDLPNIPTFKEKGYDLVHLLWRGVFVKQGVPEDRIMVLESAFQKALQTPGWVKYNEKFHQQPYYAGAKEFDTFVKQKTEEARAFFAKTGLGKK